LKPAIILTATLGLLAGCAATKETRVRTALTEAGLPAPIAQCMAEPLARDLTTSQLRSLGKVAQLRDTRVGTLTQREFLDMLRRDVDPETVGVVLRAGIGCFMRG